LKKNTVEIFLAFGLDRKIVPNSSKEENRSKSQWHNRREKVDSDDRQKVHFRISEGRKSYIED